MFNWDSDWLKGKLSLTINLYVYKKEAKNVLLPTKIRICQESPRLQSKKKTLKLKKIL